MDVVVPEEGRVKLTVEEAVKRLPDGENIHTIRPSPIGPVGCNWPRAKIIEAFKKYGVEETGTIAQGWGHGLAFKDHSSWVFVETREPK